MAFCWKKSISPHSRMDRALLVPVVFNHHTLVSQKYFIQILSKQFPICASSTVSTDSKFWQSPHRAFNFMSVVGVMFKEAKYRNELGVIPHNFLVQFVFKNTWVVFTFGHVNETKKVNTIYHDVISYLLQRHVRFLEDWKLLSCAYWARKW